MCGLKFYIPFFYTYSTRMDSNLIGVLNWIPQYLFPILLIILFEKGFFPFVPFFVLILLLYTLYEIGYIQNDTETIKEEISPTLRLSQNELQYYENNKYFIYCFRLTFSLLLSFVLYYEMSKAFYSILMCWGMLGIYVLYNQVRGYITLFLHFLLMLMRYVSPVLLFIPSVSINLIFFLSVIYPLPAVLVRLAKGKIVNVSSISIFYLKDYKDRYLFVQRYYTFFLLVYVLLSLIVTSFANWGYVMILAYFLARAIFFNLYIKHG